MIFAGRIETNRLQEYFCNKSYFTHLVVSIRAGKNNPPYSTTGNFK